ncbi:MAG: hypothetical protein ACFB14_14045 [Leptolyngbyaceae cyanobacterium]
MTQSFARKSHNHNDDDSRSVRVNFGDDTLDLVQRISELTGRDPGQAISDALGLYEWALKQVQQGRDIASTRRGRAIEQVNMPKTKSSSK